MTLSTDKATTQPLPGNGVTKEFDFDFYTWDEDELEIWLTDGDASPAEVASNYSVSLNADQSADPGGTVTYPVTGTALTSTQYLTIRRQMPFTQESVDVTSGQAFNPEVMEQALDRAAAERQELKEITDRCIRTSPGVSDSVTPDTISEYVDTKVAASVSAGLPNLNDLITGTGPQYWFDGVDDGITIPHDADLNFDTQVSILAFACLDKDTGDSQTLFAKYVGAGDLREYRFHYTASGYLQLAVGNPADGTYGGNFTTDAVLEIGKNHAYGVTFNAGAAVLYQDGEALDSTAWSGEGVSLDTLFNGTANVTIGGALGYPSGSMQRVMAFNVALTAAEIRTLSAGGPIPYKYEGASNTELTSGTLTVGKEYVIDTYESGDDFTNVGAASNETGVVFVATGTTPTTWTNASALIHRGCVLDLTQNGMTQTVWLDSSGNNLDGTVSGATLYNVKPVAVETVWVGAGSMIPCTTNGAQADTVEYTGNNVDVDVLAFDSGATEERAQFSIVLPDSWDLSGVKVRFYWTNATGASAGDGVEWAVRAVAGNDGDALDASYVNTRARADTLLAAGDLHVTPATSLLPVDGTPAAGSMIQFTVYRNTSSSNDDMTEDAWLIGCQILYQTHRSMAAW